MKKVTKINIISNDSVNTEDIIREIREKQFEEHFDIKVGDTISYNTTFHVYNEEYRNCEINGIVEKIINYLSDDYHLKLICITPDVAVLSNIKREREYYRKLYGMLNGNNTEIVEENPETGEVVIQTKKSDIKFE